MTSRGEPDRSEKRILFVCLHGSAKSLIAAEYLNRIAHARGLALRGESAGLEPDAEVPQPVVVGLSRAGIDVRDYSPRQVTGEQTRDAHRVVSFGCDLQALVPRGTPIEHWNDLPLVSDGYEFARDAIIARLEQMIARGYETTR